jgi:hypothetical protein
MKQDLNRNKEDEANSLDNFSLDAKTAQQQKSFRFSSK